MTNYTNEPELKSTYRDGNLVALHIMKEDMGVEYQSDYEDLLAVYDGIAVDQLGDCVRYTHGTYIEWVK